MAQKWTSPLEKMMQSEGHTISTVEERTAKLVEEKIQKLNATLSAQENSHKQEQIILEIDPYKICNWEFHDRPVAELGNIETLAKDILENGQAQPCIVRPYTKDSNFDYELIVGERRWRATKIANIKLKAIVYKINDQQAAIYQIAENGNRKDLSDYAKGMNYFSLIEKGIISFKELEKTLAKNKTELSRFLSFGNIPKDIWNAIEDTSKISARTASEIRAIVNKGEVYHAAIIKLATKIKAGNLGSTSLLREVEQIVSGLTSKLDTSKIEIRTFSGRHLFSWRKDTNGNISISFPKDVRNSINKKSLEEALTLEIERQLTEIDKVRLT